MYATMSSRHWRKVWANDEKVWANDEKVWANDEKVWATNDSIFKFIIVCLNEYQIIVDNLFLLHGWSLVSICLHATILMLISFFAGLRFPNLLLKSPPSPWSNRNSFHRFQLNRCQLWAPNRHPPPSQRVRLNPLPDWPPNHLQRHSFLQPICHRMQTSKELYRSEEEERCTRSSTGERLSPSSNTSANNSSEAVTLDSRRMKFDSSESRSHVCSWMEMDASSLYSQARSLKHTGDKLERSKCFFIPTIFCMHLIVVGIGCIFISVLLWIANQQTIFAHVYKIQSRKPWMFIKIKYYSCWVTYWDRQKSCVILN